MSNASSAGEERSAHRTITSVAPEKERTIDEEFGYAMKLLRTAQEMTQANLRQKLAGVDLHLDTSTIARIESGARPVRISEAVTIAGVFGVPLGMMVNLERSPSQTLRSVRWFLNKDLRASMEALSDIVGHLLEAKDILIKFPALVEEINEEIRETKDEHDLGEELPTGDQYMQWVARRLSNFEIEPYVVTEDEAADVKRFLESLISHVYVIESEEH